MKWARRRAAHSLQQCCTALAHCLARNPYDLPFVALYIGEAKGSLRQMMCVGLKDAMPPVIDVASAREHPNLARLLRQRKLTLALATKIIADVPAGAWDAAPRDVAMVPVHVLTEPSLVARLVVGINPYKRVDADVVRRDSVNPESLASKDGTPKIDRFNRTRTDMNLSTRLSAT